MAVQIDEVVSRFSTAGARAPGNDVDSEAERFDRRLDQIVDGVVERVLERLRAEWDD